MRASQEQSSREAVCENSHGKVRKGGAGWEAEPKKGGRGKPDSFPQAPDEMASARLISTVTACREDAQEANQRFLKERLFLGTFFVSGAALRGGAICSRRCGATTNAIIRRLYQDGISRDQFSGSMGLQLSPTPPRWKNLTWRENKWTEEASSRGGGRTDAPARQNQVTVSEIICT